MYITLIIFWIGFLLDGKNIISQTSKFLLLVSYKSVDLIGPTFKLLIEGFLKFIVTFPLSRFMVSGFFGREVGFRGASCIISLRRSLSKKKIKNKFLNESIKVLFLNLEFSFLFFFKASHLWWFYIVIRQSILSAVTFAFGYVIKFNNILSRWITNRIFDYRNETLKLSNFVTINNKHLGVSSIFSRKMSTNIDMNSLDNSNIKDLAFKEWLAGLIDGDGYFILTKNGYNSCEITMDARDKKVLYLIQHKYGGTVKQISNALAFKYKLRNRAGLIALINDVNGLIRNPTRLLQMNKLCVKFSIELKYPDNLTFNNGWFSGFIDSDGSVYYSESSGQVFIGISQKNKYLLEPLINIYGGRVDISSPKIEAFKYVIYRKAELFNLIDNYFSDYPLRTEKMKRVNLIKEFYLVRLYNKNKDIVKFNEWVKFKDRWEKYIDTRPRPRVS